MTMDNDYRFMTKSEPREGPDLQARWDGGAGTWGSSLRSKFLFTLKSYKILNCCSTVTSESTYTTTKSSSLRRGSL